LVESSATLNVLEYRRRSCITQPFSLRPIEKFVRATARPPLTRAPLCERQANQASFGLEAVGGYAGRAEYTNLGGSLTVFALP
jgi:hypothetical protein